MRETGVSAGVGSAALCLMEGEDALIGQLVSYPSDSRSQTGCTDRYKSTAHNCLRTFLDFC